MKPRDAKGETEAQLQARIRLDLGSVPHARLFKNSTGEAWMGKVVAQDADTITLFKPRRVPFGIFPSAGDLIGYTSVIVTAEMVGTKVAIFTSGEVKRPAIKRLPPDQQNWCDAVRAAGGFAAMLRSLEDGRALVRAE